MKRLLKKAREQFVSAVRGRTYLKETAELEYWKGRVRDERVLKNDHYEEFFTTRVGLDRSYYESKRILDVGCGPRGSLEWADMAAERVGLDPLADSYAELGADRHRMRYVAAPAEQIPFEDEHFDVVSSFNSLDHVEHLDRTAWEIMRVLKPGGRFLLLADVNHPPTPTEPITFSWDIVERFVPPLELERERHYEKGSLGIYESIRTGAPYDHDDPTERYGILAAVFLKELTAGSRES